MMITVYTTPTCAYCPLVKRLLDAKGVIYETVDLDANPDERKRLHELTGAMTVPITANGSGYVIGWKPAELLKLIGGQ